MIYSVTVIIPTYNRRESLARALDSVIAQTVRPLEILVIDDGSTDETEEFLAEAFGDVRYFFQENRGVSAARNRGIAEARGDWIAFLDSDDEWKPEKLERQLAAVREAPDVQIVHTEEIWIRNGRRVNPMKKHAKAGGLIFRQCLPLCAISPSSVMIHRDLFDRVGVFDESLPACEDYDLWLRICAGHPVLFLEEPLILKYGGHADQLSQKHWGMDRFRIRALEKVIDSGALGHEDRAAAIDELIRKIDIFVAGARKRGKADEIAAYEAMKQKFVDEPNEERAAASV